ncbi:ATPase [Deinococcus irradiatisoli]|uniref:ATPase n=1 Tax=Deinococcus irradiatisoli TaxID=2202254 RepID=A0A2Z3JMF4_9DEIO|nr:ATPase [Deinococcus irradiatisoli]
MTGVGKSTALGALASGPLRVLPDRREVTDAVMIGPLAGRAVTDRQERFALTASYRQLHPGGMAQALGSLWTVPRPGERLVFDGLRGLDEVRYAAETFPEWRFVNLHAPDLLRVRRLLGRNDAFDQAGQTGQREEGQELLAALRDLPGAGEVFSEADLQALADLIHEGHPPGEILSKTRIVLSERQNYDPDAARAFLSTLPPERVLDLDTAALALEAVASRLQGWL